MAGQMDMAVGYSPVCVFLSCAQFIINGRSLRFYFLAEKIGYRTYNMSR